MMTYRGYILRDLTMRGTGRRVVTITGPTNRGLEPDRTASSIEAATCWIDAEEERRGPLRVPRPSPEEATP
jgi:hypothetical protein